MIVHGKWRRNGMGERKMFQVMYLVRSTHEYKAVDTDELSFASGELIKVWEKEENKGN